MRVQAQYNIKRWLWRRKNGEFYAQTPDRQKSVFLTNGIFDMLDVNHLAINREARSLGNRLVVGVFSDELATSSQGRPIIPEDDRLKVVEAISCVDQASILRGDLDSEALTRNIDKYDVSIVAQAGSATPQYYAKAVKSGMFRSLDNHDGISNSEIRERVREHSAEIKVE